VVGVQDDESIVSNREAQGGFLWIHSIHVVLTRLHARLCVSNPTFIAHIFGRATLGTFRVEEEAAQLRGYLAGG